MSRSRRIAVSIAAAGQWKLQRRGAPQEWGSYYYLAGPRKYWLAWSDRLGRFTRSSDAGRLAKNAPAVLEWAEAVLQEAVTEGMVEAAAATVATARERNMKGRSADYQAGYKAGYDAGVRKGAKKVEVAKPAAKVKQKALARHPEHGWDLFPDALYGNDSRVPFDVVDGQIVYPDMIRKLAVQFEPEVLTPEFQEWMLSHLSAH